MLNSLLLVMLAIIALVVGFVIFVCLLDKNSVLFNKIYDSVNNNKIASSCILINIIYDILFLVIVFVKGNWLIGIVSVILYIISRCIGAVLMIKKGENGYYGVIIIACVYYSYVVGVILGLLIWF